MNKITCNTFNRFMVSTLLCAASFSAMAHNPSAILKVTGKLTPTSCNISLSNNILDFGTISSGQFTRLAKGKELRGIDVTDDVGYIKRNDKSVVLTASCDGIATLGVKPKDNYDNATVMNFRNLKLDGVTLGQAFGLRRLEGEKRTGVYFLNYSDATVDGAGKPFYDNKKMADTKIWGINENTPSSGRNFSVKITPTLVFYYDREDAGTMGETQFEGSTTFELKYI
ncbi:hypothetical protein [Candidatus Regiella endosymbiont of Tuberolachnus salignus]|uniref:hypothetical protein n=1 Tax=Candidatus Regiella endosymbiont of Tuberolachnus salignus TaxID=3077956 RepID=UPI0030D08793